MTVEFTSLKRTFELHKDEYEEAILRSLRSGWYILGNELSAFESEFADYLGIKHCVGVGCGQDALIIAVRALGIGQGDEVIVAGNTYIATVLGVTENQATPVFVDCNDYFELDELQAEAAITSRTKAILTTNLYGQCSNLQKLRSICDEHGIYLIEDCAQCHGSYFGDYRGGTAGDVSCFSFYPTKPLGAFGDGGAIVTNDDCVADTMRMLRNYGSKEKYVNEITGINSRLDELQAAILRVNLKHLEEMNDERIRIAKRYLTEIVNDGVVLPSTHQNANHVYHIFAVRCEQRDALKRHLSNLRIQTQIHYPIPPHQAECYRGEPFASVELPRTESFAGQELSLPIYCGMPEHDVDRVIEAVNSFKPEIAL